jgi:hypothetical protein
MKTAILTAANARYFTYLKVFVDSLCVFNAEMIPLVVIDLGLTEAQKTQLRKLPFFDRFVSLSETYDAWVEETIPAAERQRIEGQLTPGTAQKRRNWLRKLMIGRVPGGYDWLFWVDADIMVSDRIGIDDFLPRPRHPFNADYGDEFTLLGHVRSPEFVDALMRTTYAGHDLSALPFGNFNSGVMAFRPAYLDEIVERHVRPLLASYPEEMLGGFGLGNILGDQALLNMAFAAEGRKIGRLSNMMNSRWSLQHTIATRSLHGIEVPVALRGGQQVKLLHYPGIKPDSDTPMGDREPVRQLFRQWDGLGIDWARPFHAAA